MPFSIEWYVTIEMGFKIDLNCNFQLISIYMYIYRKSESKYWIWNIKFLNIAISFEGNINSSNRKQKCELWMNKQFNDKDKVQELFSNSNVGSKYNKS